jgi:lysophospholipase L1-like esterase
MMNSILQEESLQADELTILFLGDSVTDNARFAAYLDAYVRQNPPGPKLSFIPLGVSSETASGLTEKTHPFPRPCIHQRVKRALQETNPDWVVACYGMNDAIYHPFSEEWFAAYTEGMRRLLAEIRSAGAKALVMTPPPFDPASFTGGRLLPGHAEDFSYAAVYEGYDEVLARYSEWLKSPDCPADACIDIRGPLAGYTAARRLAEPDYRSGDGIHPHDLGHWVMAQTILGGLFGLAVVQMPSYVEEPEKSEFFQLVLKRHELLRASWKEHVGHTNPNKEAAALALEEALAEARKLEEEIGHLLKA